MKHLPKGKKADGVAQAINNLLLPFKHQTKSITMDNGKEFAKHYVVRDKLEVDTYFTNPYCSWEKGQIENMNKLIREYLPKNQHLNNVKDKLIKNIQIKINNRPRKGINYVRPFQLFYKFVEKNQN